MELLTLELCNASSGVPATCMFGSKCLVYWSFYSTAVRGPDFRYRFIYDPVSTETTQPN